MQNGEETLLPMALPFAGFAMPGLGSYFYNIKVDGTEVNRVPFRVISTNPFGASYPRSA